MDGIRVGFTEGATLGLKVGEEVGETLGLLETTRGEKGGLLRWVQQGSTHYQRGDQRREMNENRVMKVFVPAWFFARGACGFGSRSS